MRVHVFEDFETDIEKRWWLRGAVETNQVPPSLSASLPNRRACRATESKDFDDKMGDPTKSWKAVIFNPVPGPPMGANTRLSFRYWLNGTGTLRVQIYSLSNNYHRHLTLTNLPQGAWQAATVDMTHARRPDGSGGPLAADERIDDIQFYVTPEAELLIDDIVLYEAAPPDEQQPFPKRTIFTGWFDTGQQGKEWPGDFEIVRHTPPLTWKCAKSVVNQQGGAPWIRVNLRGLRPLSELNRLRFRYRLEGSGPVRVILANSQTRQEWASVLNDAKTGSWAESALDFRIKEGGAFADSIQFHLSAGATLLVDDVLLHEPAESAKPRHEAVRDWPALPAGHVLGQCVGVGVDSRGNVLVFHRSGRTWSTPFPTEPIAAPTVSVIEGKSGKLLAAWGANEFIMPHGLSLDHADNVWLTDVGRHQVFKFSPDGQKLLLALGERGVPGADRAHFNLPTDVAVLADGSFYVSDGYKNTRVVKFTAQGKYDFEWGGKGAGPGQFNLPHGVAVDARGRVIVCDRSNSRLQVFDPRGKFLTEWKGPLIGRPYGVSIGADGHVFLIDGGDGTGKTAERPRAVELDADGRVLDRFGAFGSGAGEFELGHDIAVAKDGAVYVADAAGKRLQKFVRRVAP